MIALIADHLWQSTLLAAVAALLTMALRNNRAQVRSWLWLAASVKFLVPFAALVTLGQQFGWRSSAQIAQPAMTSLIDAMSKPFSPPQIVTILPAPSGTASPQFAAMIPLVLLTIWFTGCSLMLLMWWGRWRRVAAVVQEAEAIEQGRELSALRRLEPISGIKKPLPMVASTISLEPGVFGILNPVLLWPLSIGERLADAQVDAILVHELAHVRRRDNLAAAVHMIVQSIFWFHPLVWWIGARLVDERERACDEEVVRLGSEPQVYAESILRTCEFYVEAPLACVAGVTGADLKKRIEGIMLGHARDPLTDWRKALLVTAGAAAIAGPLAVGMLNAPPLNAQTQRGTRASQQTQDAAATRRSIAEPGPRFEVASIEPNKSGVGGVRLQVHPGGRFTASNVTLFQLVREAYRLQNVQVSGGPSWANVEHFDIAAIAEGGHIPDPFSAAQSSGGPDPLSLMLRALLAERFRLTVHLESRDQPVFGLVLARSDGRPGPQLKKAGVDCDAEARARGNAAPPDFPPSGRPGCGITMRPGTISAGGATLNQLANLLSGLVRRTVVNRTALDGTFDFDLRWTPDQPVPPKPDAPGTPDVPPADPNGPSMFTAIQEQLGLKLDSQRGPVDVLVIDRAERPTEN